MTKRLNSFLILVLGVLLTLSVVMGVTAFSVKASTDPVFTMENGVYLKTSTTGLRFVVKMDEDTYQGLKNNDDKTLKFVIAPKVLFDQVQDGKYLEMEQKIVVEAKEYTKFYKEGDFYYVNGCVFNMKPANLKLDYTAVAVIDTVGGEPVYATMGDTVRNVYSVVNSAVLDAEAETATELLNTYDFMGGKDYPFVVENDDQYKALVALINSDVIASGVNAKIDETVNKESAVLDEGKEIEIEKAKYTITWKVGEVTTTSVVEEGALPVYEGTPTKAEDTVAYEFKCWDKTIAEATEDTTYTALFVKKLLNKHASALQSIVESDLEGEYVLGEDIDMTGVTFKSIGVYDTAPFSGIFDGRGYAIKNLTVSEDSADNSYGKGTVFAHNNGTIKNLFVNFTAPAIGQYVGFVGWNAARVLNVAVIMNATSGCGYGNWFNGVVVARNQGDAAVVRNCFGELKGLSGEQWCGPVVGYNYSNNYGLTNLIGIVNGTTTPSDAAYGCKGTPLFTCSYNSSDNAAFRPDANSKLYDTALEFINSGFVFDSANGWESFWKLENGKFYFGENLIAEDNNIYLGQKDAANLQSIIESNLAGTFVLTEDIDMTGVTFKSIGGVDSGSDISAFTGVIDGRGYAIKNLTITGRSAKDQYGVYLAGASNFIANNGGTVKNIAFVNLTMANSANFVGVIGRNSGTVNNVYADITLTGNMTSMAQMNGGIVARFDGGSVKNCIVNIHASGLSGNQVFGTVVGKNYSGAEYPIANCYAITNGMAISYDTANGGGRDVLYGLTYDSNTRRPKNSANYEDVVAFFSNVTALSGTDGWADYWTLANNELKFGDEVVVGLAGVTILAQKDAANLQSIIESNLAGTFVLTEDIDMTGITFKSIGGVDSGSDISAFTGVIDGRGYAIKNLTITGRSAKDQYGVYRAGASNFIANNGGTVKNIAFVNLTMANRPNFVGIIGQNNGTVSNVYADITLTGNMTSMAQMNGGIVARFDGGSVKNCIVNIHESGLTGNQVFGTVVGKNYSGAEYPIANCYAITNGMVISYDTACGGGRDVLYGLTYDSNTRRPKNSANYETFDAFVAAVSSLSGTDGWADYWTLENNTLKFGDEIIGTIAE